METEVLFKETQPVRPRRTQPLPKWLRRKIPRGGEHFKTDALLKEHRLNLVCEEAKCPNRMECYANKTATFLTLGHACTRACGFCDIAFAKTLPPPDPTEGTRIASTAEHLGLKHIVLTMVTRDDLPDGGAAALAHIIHTLRSALPTSTIETLTSDFQGDHAALHTLLDARPEVFNHNIETIRHLTPRVRHKATYDRSLNILREAKRSGKAPHIKSGIMVGLGETTEEIHQTLQDLKNAGCDAVTIGQYLQASPKKLRVKRFVTPEEFKSFETYGLSIGLTKVLSGPLVRSSYNAHTLFIPFIQNIPTLLAPS